MLILTSEAVSKPSQTNVTLYHAMKMGIWPAKMAKLLLLASVSPAGKETGVSMM